MKLVGRIPVEPLDDERLTNIERRIVAGAADAAATLHPVRESRLHLVLGFAIAVVVVMGAGLVGWKARGGADPATVAATEPLKVQTDQERSTLDIGDARIESSPATAFTVTRPDNGVLIAMVRGKVELEVGKRGDRAPLTVRAGDTDVIVVGTRFSVDYGDGTGDVDVRVTEGVVMVVRQRKEVRVAAGEAWTTDQGLVALAELGARGPGATIGGPDRRGSGELEIDMGTAPDVLHDRVAKVPDARVPANGSNATTRPIVPPNVRPRSLEHPDDPKGDLKSVIRSQPVLAPLDVGTPDGTTAMAKYREIMLQKKGPDEAYAFYSMAYVQYLKLGRDSDALSTLDRFEQRAATSEYLVPALWLRVRIRCLKKIDDNCRLAAEAYQKRAGKSATWSVAERITQ